jgi:hypothetical protein
VTSIGDGAFGGCTGLTAFTVALGNHSYMLADGLLLSKDGQTLVACPAGRLGSVEVPSTVTAIGGGAFEGCVNLTAIAIPSLVTSCGYQAFFGCSNLTAIPLPPTVTSIGDQAFLGCTQITSITIPSGVTVIGRGTFAYCTNLSSVTFPYDSLTSIGDEAFFHCTSLVSVTIPSSVLSLGDEVFYDCTSLTSVLMLGNAPQAGANVFQGVPSAIAYYVSGTSGWGSVWAGIPTALAETQDAPKNINGTPGNGNVSLSWTAPTDNGSSSINGYVLRYSADERGTWSEPMSVAASPTSLTVPGLVNGHRYWFVVASRNSAGVGPYSDPVAATPNGIIEFLFTVSNGEATITSYKGAGPIQDVPSTIGGYPVTGFVPKAPTSGFSAFNNTVTTVRLPSTVRTITGSWQTYGALKSIEVDSSNKVFASVGGILYSRDLETLIRCPQQCAGELRVLLGVTRIAESGFSGCRRIEQVTLPNSLTDIGNNAFSGCIGLKVIALPEALRTIGSYVFQECRSLERIYVPSGVRVIPRSAFTSCVRLINVELASGVEGIEPSAFDSCISLVTITVPASIATIGDRAFSGCVSLAKVMCDGDAPVAGVSVFRSAGQAVVYYRRGSAGWTESYAGIPTATTPLEAASLRAVALSRSVRLDWAPSASNGGSPVTDYTIQYSSNGGESWMTFPDGSSTALAATVTGLANGSSYVFRVAAVNAAGTSVFTEPTSRVTPLPAAAGRPVALARNGYVDLRWAVPRLYGVPKVTDYVIRYSVDNGATWSRAVLPVSATPSRRVFVANGNTYVFQVAPVVAGGVGVFSRSSVPVTPYSPAAKPAAPTGVSGVKNGAMVVLSWSAVSGNTGGPVKDYVVQYRLNIPNARWSTYRDLVSPATSANLRLRAGYSYVFRVAARNLAGIGAFSTQSAPVTA